MLEPQDKETSRDLLEIAADWLLIILVVLGVMALLSRFEIRIHFETSPMPQPERVSPGDTSNTDPSPHAVSGAPGDAGRG